MELDDELLPGRTEVEERALGPTRNAIARAERERAKAFGAGKPPLRSLAGMAARAERALAELPEHDAKVSEAKAAHRAKLQELADARRALLPPDAVRITVGMDDEYGDDRRYPVGYETESGRRGSLGGCSNIGAQQRLVKFYEAELNARRLVGRMP